MGDQTGIAWTDCTFNPWMGCFKVSQGCKHCYAETLTNNKMGIDVFGADTSKRRRTGYKVWSRPPIWNREAKLRGRVKRIFCASLADLFEDAPGPNRWRADVWDMIRHTPYLDWQILTKRPENILRMLPDEWDHNRWGFWPHVWLGTSIEDNHVAERSPVLVDVPAWNHFISYEPAIGPADEVPLDCIEWMIVGGESGPGYRKFDLCWALDMWSRCAARGIAYFFKQDAGYRTEMGIDALGQVVRHYPLSWNRAELRAAT
jgi:protein gp37